MNLYNKALELSDKYEEMDHIAAMQGIMAGSTVRFEHPHRAWEYGLALNALRKARVKTILDVGGGGSIFAPSAEWPDVGMSTLQVDPGDVGAWIEGQRAQLGLYNKAADLLQFEQEDFLSWKSRKKFDGVTCLSVIEHVPDDKKFFKKLLGFVSPGGVMVLTTDFHSSGKAQVDGHIRTYNERSMKNFLSMAEKENFAPFGDDPDWSYQGRHVNGYNFAALVIQKIK